MLLQIYIYMCVCVDVYVCVCVCVCLYCKPLLKLYLKPGDTTSCVSDNVLKYYMILRRLHVYIYIDR